MPSAPTLAAYSAGITLSQLKLFLDQSFKPQSLITPLVPCIYHTSGCKKTFDIREELEQHVLRNLTTDKDHEWCHECDLGFANIKAIRHHWVVSEIHEFACPVCAREFQSEGGLKRHTKQEYTRKKEVTCLGCNEMFYGGDGAAIEALMKHHLEPGHCKSKETTTHGGNQDTGILDLAGGIGKVEWPTLEAPKKQIPALPKLPGAQQAKRVSTVRIVDKLSKPEHKMQAEQVGTVGSYKSSATVDHLATAIVTATSNTPNPPTQVQQNIVETDKVTDKEADKEEDTVEMRKPKASSIPAKAQTAAPVSAPATAPGQNATRPVSYASAIKPLVQEVRDEKKSAAAVAGQSSTQKPAQPAASPWGIPRGKLNASAAFAPQVSRQVASVAQARQPLAPSPAFVTSNAYATAATSFQPRKKTGKWGPRSPRRSARPAEWYRAPDPFMPLSEDSKNPQVRKWLETLSDTPDDAHTAGPSSLPSAPIQENERHPISRPRTPDKGDYEIVLQEHMNGNFVEDDGNWISAAELQKLLREQTKKQMPGNEGSRARRKRRSAGQGTWIDREALLRLDQYALKEKLGNPSWFDISEPEVEGSKAWGRHSNDQSEYAGSGGEQDAENRQVSSSAEEPTWQNTWQNAQPEWYRLPDPGNEVW